MIEKICMVLIFVGVAVGVGIYCRRHTGSVDGFILGGRNVGPWLSAFAFGTSYFSAVIFVGYAGQFGWKYGVAATWIGIGNAILGSLLAWWVLGPRTREMTHRLGASTMPEFFGARFQSKGLRIAAAAIIFVFLIPYTASVYNGLSRLFGMAFGLPYEVCVIGMAAITWSFFDNPDRDLEEVGKIAQAASSIALECTKAVPDITVERIRKKMSGEIEPLLDEVRTA